MVRDHSQTSAIVPGFPVPDRERIPLWERLKPDSMRVESFPVAIVPGDGVGTMKPSVYGAFPVPGGGSLKRE
jgi:hypothetical protein